MRCARGMGMRVWIVLLRMLSNVYDAGLDWYELVPGKSP